MKLLPLFIVLLTLKAWAVKNELPHPRIEGKKTLLGIDSDNDGVRDDVQFWIDNEYSRNSTPSTNLAMKQLAKYSQLILQLHADKEKAVPLNIKAVEAITCLMWVNNNGDHLSTLVKNKMLNTSERIRAFVKVDSYFDGAGSPEQINKTKLGERNKFCEFKATKE
jgi:hypothetical protein